MKAEQALEEIVPHWARENVSLDRRIADSWHWQCERGWAWTAFISNGNIHMRCFPASWKLRESDYPCEDGTLERMKQDIQERVSE